MAPTLTLLLSALLLPVFAWSDEAPATASVEKATTTNAPAPPQTAVRMLVQSSPLAGSQYYGADTLWAAMATGDALTLHREPENPHDSRAVRVEWRGAKLGYLPRRENAAVAAALDRGEALEARISRLTRHANPWRRVEVQVWVRL